MTEKKSNEFVLGDDQEEAVEITPKKEIEDLQFHRLSYRVTLISILIPILIGIIGYFIYNDIQKKVIKVHDTGSTEVQTLSKDTESKFSSLSVQLSKLEQNFAEKTKTLDESLTAIKNDISGISKKLKTAESNLDDLKKSTSGISGKLAPMENSLEAIKTDINETDNKLGEAISDIETELGKTKSDLLNLNSKFSGISSSKLDRTTFVSELNKINETMDQSFFDMNKKLNNLDAKINRISSSAGTTRNTPAAETGSKDNASKEVQMIRNKPAINPSSPELLEQDIQE
ncbi:MAG: hypothetical protein KJ737_02205 [Proteobacteria bacterium]|nr:hypothetical protein [Pseudomonadota bacterium]